MGSLSFGHILLDIKLLFFFFVFNNVFVCYARWLGNCVAHWLARRAISNYFLVWMEFVPPDMCDVYNNDLYLNYEQCFLVWRSEEHTSELQSPC